jgi:hypothetical protein
VEVPPGATVSFNLFIDGALVEATSLVVADVAAEHLAEVAEHHASLSRQATDEGRTWRVEVTFWDGEQCRWGTDVDGMVVPIDVGVGHLSEAIERHWGNYQPCPSTRGGYHCQRGRAHPDHWHAQLLRKIPTDQAGKMLVALWHDDDFGVRVKRIDAAEAGMVAP